MTTQQGQPTPGPWEIHGEVEKDYYVHGANRICTIPKPSGYYQSPAEREANACLIAAAPELLTACRTVLATVNYTIGSEESSRYKPMADIVRAAISRAEV